jgi:hypothetical protein
VKCCPKPRRGTHRSRSCFTRCCSRGASSSTTSRPTRLWWSPHSRRGRSSVTRMRRAGLPSGLWNLWVRRSPTRRTRQLSLRSWQISSLSERTHN